MAKKKPFLAIILIMLTFAIIAFITSIPNSGITGGFAVYGKLTSMFSKNALVTIGPTAIFITILTVTIIALQRISKES